MALQQKANVINKIKAVYPWIEEEQLGVCYDMALSDYLNIRYPSSSSRPDFVQFNADDHVGWWIYKRMIDILGRAGGLNLTAYRENGVNLTYGGSYIDPQLVAMVMPRAGVPK